MGDNDSLCVTTGDTNQLDESFADYVWFQIRRRTTFYISLCVKEHYSKRELERRETRSVIEFMEE